MNGVYVATMNSEHFEWTAIGLTEDEAIDTIVREWQEGAGHERRDEMTREELQEYYGIYCRLIEFGKCEWE
jgi:hypothetical protein